MKGKIIAIEGTDGSGKGLQSNLLVSSLQEMGIPARRLSFPDYATPTGQIIGECLIGLDEFGDYPWFEKPGEVDPLVAAAYYAADRRYNIDKILKPLNQGYNLVLDRYVYSNMAHQGGKVPDKVERLKVYKKLELLEFEVMGLPRPDDTYYLSMPYDYSEILRLKRGYRDKIESDRTYMINSDKAYNELTDIYGFVKINCVKDDEIRKAEDIHQELVSKVLKKTFNR